MPEGTNHTPAQNKAIDAKARALIPVLCETLLLIFQSSSFSPFSAQRKNQPERGDRLD
jgi:hypothetical protein